MSDSLINYNEYSGKFINSMGLKLFFLTNKNNNSFKYVDGFKYVDKQFNQSGSCNPGGFYFVSEEQLIKYVEYTDDTKYIRRVEIPSDARVYVDKCGFIADSFILGPVKIFYMDNYFSYDECIASVNKNWRLLKYLENQKVKICIDSVSRNGRALKYVKNQTPEICRAAIYEFVFALQYVRSQTCQLCLDAVSINGLALQCVKNQTLEVCLKAVTQCGEALKYVNNQTPDICKAAISQNSQVLKYVDRHISLT